MQWAQLVGKDYNPISTSRPGIDNSTSAVLTGLYQFEMGTNFITGMGIDTTISIPVLLRMGVSKNTELQVGFANKYLTLGLLYGGISNINGLENSIIFSAAEGSEFHYFSKKYSNFIIYSTAKRRKR